MQVIVLFLWATAAISQVSELSYKLDTGDKIQIQVFDEQDLSIQTRVSSTGTINYAFLGQLQVAGRTTAELEKHITELLLDDYLVNPSVNVSILEFRPFFINGEVGSPGRYAYQPGLTLEKAVTLAGGLSDRASKRKIYVQRNENGFKKSKIGMEDKVFPGDVISIEEGFF